MNDFNQTSVEIHAKYDSIDDARKLFDVIPQRDFMAEMDDGNDVFHPSNLNKYDCNLNKSRRALLKEEE